MLNTCSSCSTDNPGDAKFCKQCGASLSNTSKASSDANAPLSSLPTKRFRMWLAFLLIASLVLAVSAGWWLYQRHVSLTQAQDEAAINDSDATSTKPATPANKRKSSQTPGVGAGAPQARQTAQALCADRTNFVTRDFCMNRLCHNPEHAREEACMKILQMEEDRRNQSSG